MNLKRILYFGGIGCLILVLLSGCTARLPQSNTMLTGQTGRPSASVSDETAALLTTSVPQATEVPTDPLPPAIDAEQLIADLLSHTQELSAPVSLTAEFYRWIEERYGVSVLSELLGALEAGTYTHELWYTLTGNSIFVLGDLYSGAAETSSNVYLLSQGVQGGENAVTTMTFGGDICFADNYLPMQYLANTGKSITDCIDERLIAEMQSADIAFLNNEFAISDRGSPLAGKAYTFRAAPENTALYHTLGVNIVSLANNHAYDFGADAFADTMRTLKEYEIATVGGGMNLEEAMQPVYYLVNGRKIAFVAATRAEKYRLTPQATETASGVLRCYDPTLFLETIREADQNSDFVVACIHWGTEYSAVLEDVQKETARTYIDAGVDLIIGGHAHQLQGIEFYNGKAIYYNLGNFWFNNKEIETGLVKIELSPDGGVKHIFLPALQKDCRTSWEVGTEKGSAILDRLEGYSVNVSIDENGLVTETADEGANT